MEKHFIRISAVLIVLILLLITHEDRKQRKQIETLTNQVNNVSCLCQKDYLPYDLQFNFTPQE